MDDKQKLIERTVKSINDTFGAGIAQTLDGAFEPNKIKGFIPTNNLCLDWVIGRPGFPVGRVSEVAGKYGSGKSSFIASTIGNVQRTGGLGILVDAEKSYDPTWGTIHKVIPDELIYLDPPHLQGVFDEVIMVIKKVRESQSDLPIFVAVDSVSAVPTAAELEVEDSTESKQSAAHAVIISEGMRRISTLLHKQNVAIVFVSQLKENPRASWGKTSSKIGGSAIDFSAGLLIELARTGYITQKEKKIGQHIQITSRKNKFNFVDPLRVRVVDLYYREGFRPKEMLLDFMADKELGLIKKEGSWYEYEGSKFQKTELAEKLDDSLFPVVYEKLGIRA
jgi:recombination protein RecA